MVSFLRVSFLHYLFCAPPPVNRRRLLTFLLDVLWQGHSPCPRAWVAL